MSLSDEKHGFTYVSNWVQECIVFLACFFYLLLRIHPVLILEVHPSVFLKGTDFLGDFLKIPGGLVNWLSSLLMQFWFSDFLSSLLLAICFWIVGFLTRKWIETLTENRPIHTFHLIPVGLLLVLYSNYDFDLSVTLAIIINLFFLVLFIRWSPKQPMICIGLGLVITVLLYWITGGAFLMFAVLCGLGDLLFRRKIVSGLLLLLISALLPFVASISVFLITLKQAYLHNLTFENSIESWIIACSLPAFFLLTLIIASIAKIPGIWKPFKKFSRLAYVWEKLLVTRKLFQKFSRFAYIWKWAMGTLLIVAGTILLAKDSSNDIKRIVLEVNRAVREERWTDVLKLTQYNSNETPLLSCQTNLALFQTNKLLDSMFAYPQSKGTAGLLMNQTWCLSWPEEASNVSWKLGLVNESQHYAHEALERRGPTADLLKRLGMVYMLKGDYKAARRFFLNLKDVPFQGKTAEYLLRLNENPGELTNDLGCKYIQLVMPHEDLISRGKASSPKLELLLKRNQNNKMAFEYMIADLLLTGNFNELLDHLSDFNSLGYSQLPRHVQEAVIFIASMDPNFGSDQLKKWVQLSNFKRFLEYRQILISHKGDRNGAMQDLKDRYADTYWYYFMFVKPAPRPSENQNEFQ
ncbi:MAG: DUF6057 family protein [Bacteroidota bacterium]